MNATMKRTIQIAAAALAFLLALALAPALISAATVDDVSFSSTPTGRATASASADNALDYQWFTLTNNGADAVTLTLESSTGSELFRVTADQKGGLSALTDKKITLAAGASETVAVYAPQLGTVSLWAIDGQDNRRQQPGLGWYWVYYSYVQYNTSPAVVFANERASIQPGGSVSKTPPASFQSGGESYVPVDGSAKGLTYSAVHTEQQRTIRFEYKPYVEEAYSFSVNYVKSGSGEFLSSETKYISAPVKNADGTKTYPTVTVTPKQLLSVQSVGGRSAVYKLDPDVSQGTRVHAYQDGVKTYTYYMVEDSQIPSKAYQVTVRYIDKATGLIIATQRETILVDPAQVTTTTIQIPNEITSATARRYVKCAGEPDSIAHLSNDTANTVREVFFELDTSLPTTDYDITVIYNDAATNTEVKRETVTVPYLSGVTFIADSQFDHNGTAYTLAVGEERRIVHEFANTKRTYVINYNSNGSNLQPATVTINYVENVANGKLYSTTITVPVNDVLVHIAPERYDAGGKTYVLSSGQSRMIYNYYGDVRDMYTFFYRVEGEVDPALPNNTPGTTIVDNLQNVVDQIGGNPEDVANDNVQVNPDNSLDIQQEYPTDTFTEIPNNEIPLAGGENAASKFPWGWTVLGSDIVILGVGMLALRDRLFGKSRKRR